MVGKRSRFVRRDDWSASWIWCKGDSRPRNFYLYARKAFKLSAKPSSATLRITADSRYKLFVNGSFVGRGPVPSDPHQLSYDTYDIAAFLTKDLNAIAVLVHHIGQGTYNYIPGRAALICEADIEWEGGSEKIVTDEAWRVLPAASWTAAGARMSRRLGWQEVYDANQEPQGWTMPKFHDLKWQEAVVLGRPPMQPFDRLVAREIPHLREEVVHPAAVVSLHDCPPLPTGVEPPDIPDFMANESLKPSKEGHIDKPERLLSPKNDAATIGVPQSGGVSVVLDFGREVFGHFELAVTGSHGGIVDIGYSEVLESGRVKPNRGDVRYSDRLILRKGEQTWCTFEPRAFRYVQLDFRNCPKPVSISRVQVREVTYPVERRGSFESSDLLLNNVWKTAAETARLCMQDTYIDSPWRERAQWWDNAAVASQVAYSAFGDTALLKQGLRHIAASQEQDGAVSALYPSATWELFPDFGALWVMSVWDSYAESEDRDLLAELHPAVARWLKWIGRFTDGDGLLSRVRGNLFIDWAEIDRRGEVVALNCLYLGALRAASHIAEALRRKSEAEEWAGMALALRAAIAKHFWSPTRGLFADARVDGKLQEHYSRQTNILAALFDVADHYQKSSIYRQALDEKGLPPITTPRFMSLLVEGLFQSGYAAQALDVLRRKWGEMISSGATTFWEYFSPSDSLCYASSSAPAYQLQAYVLGIRPTGEPGRVRIEPHPADLQWAKGVVPTAAGAVSVDWKMGTRGFTMELEVPRGVTAEVVPPREKMPCRVLVDGKDRHDASIEVGPGHHRVQVLKESFARLPRHRVSVPEELEAPQHAPIPPGRGDIETVEQMIKILSELEKEQTASELAEKPVERRRRHHRRGKRASAAVQTQEAGSEAREVHEEASPLVEETSEPAAEGRPSRRRSRRSKAQAAETAPQVEQATPQPEKAPTVEQAAEPTPERRRPRRRKHRSPAEAAEAAPPAPVEVSAAEPAGEAEQSPGENGKKPRRRYRRRRRPAQEGAGAGKD